MHADLDGRALLMHGGVPEWGLSASFRLVPKDGNGPFMEVAMSYNGITDETAAFWNYGLSPETLSVATDGVAFSTKAGWGVPTYA